MRGSTISVSIENLNTTLQIISADIPSHSCIAKTQLFSCFFAYYDIIHTNMTNCGSNDSNLGTHFFDAKSSILTKKLDYFTCVFGTCCIVRLLYVFVYFWLMQASVRSLFCSVLPRSKDQHGATLIVEDKLPATAIRLSSAAAALLFTAKNKYLLICQVSRYCILSLHNRALIMLYVPTCWHRVLLSMLFSYSHRGCSPYLNVAHVFTRTC